MGEDVEFADFVATRRPALLRWAGWLTGDRGRAEDLLQQALTSTHRQWRRVSAAGSEAYVRTAVRHGHASWWRRGGHREVPTDVLPERPGPEPTSAVDDRTVMWAALATLPPGQRAVLVLRYYEDLSERDIARVLGISPGTVKSQAAKGLATLRARWPGERG